MENIHVLPVEYQIDTIAGDSLDVITGCLEVYYLENNTFTIESFEQLYHNHIINLLSLVASVYDTEQADETAYKVAHETFFFAIHVGDILPSRMHIHTENYFLSDSPEELRERMQDDAMHYLAARPFVNDLIARFSDTLDPSGNYSELARTFAAVMLMHIEEGEAKQYIAAQLGEYATELSDISDVT